MATAIVRSGLFSALRGGASAPRASPAFKRSFASSAHHDEAAEASKWEKITYAGIATCSILAIHNLSKGHPHNEEPPPYPYLHIRNKEFPWVLLVLYNAAYTSGTLYVGDVQQVQMVCLR